MHGDLGQGAREQALRAFRNGKVDVLVATDVAARGIDVEDVTHVVNYQCPEDEKTYLHRIGRTGRAGTTGIAVTFVDWDDLPRWGLINKALDLAFGEPEETYSSSRPPLRGARHPAARHRDACRAAQRTRAGWTPRRSRTSARPAGPAGTARRSAARRAPSGATATAVTAAATAAATGPTGRSGPSGRRARTASAPAPAAASRQRPLPRPPRRPVTHPQGPATAPRAGVAAAAADVARAAARSRAGQAPPSRADAVGADLDVLRRWESGGATWRVLARTPGGLDVALLTCDGGEQVGRLVSTEPDLLAYVGDRTSRDDGRRATARTRAVAHAQTLRT